MNADGSQQRKLNKDGDEGHPAWSLDGTKIAFVGLLEIFLMNADGSGKTKVTNDGRMIFDRPSWAPSGAQIAFTSSCGGANNFDICRVNVDGLEQTNLTNSPADDRDPAWSPVHNKIAFASNRDGNYEIYVMDADGSAPTRLTDNPGEHLRPAWSPDGTKIAFSSKRDGNYDIYVMNADSRPRDRCYFEGQYQPERDLDLSVAAQLMGRPFG